MVNLPSKVRVRVRVGLSFQGLVFPSLHFIYLDLSNKLSIAKLRPLCASIRAYHSLYIPFNFLRYATKPFKTWVALSMMNLTVKLGWECGQHRGPSLPTTNSIVIAKLRPACDGSYVQDQMQTIFQICNRELFNAFPGESVSESGGRAEPPSIFTSSYPLPISFLPRQLSNGLSIAKGPKLCDSFQVPLRFNQSQRLCVSTLQFFEDVQQIFWRSQEVFGVVNLVLVVDGIVGLG